ncbi:MAG: amidohydrolase family protein [Acidimicrobiales bacterium]
MAAIDWLETERIPLRFPEIRIVMAEGGIGWVPMLIDRLVYRRRFERLPQSLDPWPGTAPPPEEALRRNFRFTSFFDPSTLDRRHQIGIDNILFESDYPHQDSSWPDSQLFLASQMQDYSPEDVERLAWRNAAALYGLSVTPETLIDARRESPRADHLTAEA